MTRAAFTERAEGGEDGSDASSRRPYGEQRCDGSQEGHGLRRRLRPRRGPTGTRVSRKWSLQEEEDGTGQVTKVKAGILERVTGWSPKHRKDVI